MQVETKNLQHEPFGMYCECRMLILFMKCNPKHKIHLETLCFSYSEIRGSRPTFVPEKFVIFIFLFTIVRVIKLRALRWVTGKKKDLVARAQGKVWKMLLRVFCIYFGVKENDSCR